MPDEMDGGGVSGIPSEELEAFRRFQRFMQRQPTPSSRTTRGRREESEEEDGDGKGGAPGPPPSWDGSGVCEDYLIKAKLWIATTKSKPRMRGALLLKALSGTPFETFKHYAQDSAWLSDPKGAEKLLEDMNRPEHYGDDRQEHMLTAMSRITFHMRRSKGEHWREYFARWETAIRKVHEHKIKLPEAYEGFLLINGLQLADSEVKALLNYSRGDISPAAIKEWLRKSESRLNAQELGKDKDTGKKPAAVYFAEDEQGTGSYEREIHNDLDELELHEGEHLTEDDIIEESEAAEVLATMIQQKKKTTFAQSQQKKKEKELGRGYSGGGGGPRGGMKSFRGEFRGRLSIEEIKSKTRCKSCGQVGHWHRDAECPNKNKGSSSNHANESHYLANQPGSQEAFFVGYTETRYDEKEQIIEDKTSGTMTTERAMGHHDQSAFCAARELPVEEDTILLAQDHSTSAEYVPGVSNHLSTLHDLFFFEQQVSSHTPKSKDPCHDFTCATIDTGCQRLAIGRETLHRYAGQLPGKLEVLIYPDVNRFRSVHGTSGTTHSAAVPCSLGVNGSYLKPAIFDEGIGREAPFLISLSFMRYCNATITLDTHMGYGLKLGETHVACHIGPTGALRVPLQQFTTRMIQKLRDARDEVLGHDLEFEILSLNAPTTGATTSSSPSASRHLPAGERDQVPGGHAAGTQASSWRGDAAREPVRPQLGAHDAEALGPPPTGEHLLLPVPPDGRRGSSSLRGEDDSHDAYTIHHPTTCSSRSRSCRSEKYQVGNFSSGSHRSVAAIWRADCISVGSRGATTIGRSGGVPGRSTTNAQRSGGHRSSPSASSHPRTRRIWSRRHS